MSTDITIWKYNCNSSREKNNENWGKSRKVIEYKSMGLYDTSMFKISHLDMQI